MSKVYIAGKISGIPDISQVWEKFYNVEQDLINKGLDVVNPLRVVGINSLEEYIEHEKNPKEYKFYIKETLKALVDGCEKAFFLPCWTNSTGAKCEHMVAQTMGMEIIYL